MSVCILISTINLLCKREGVWMPQGHHRLRGLHLSSEARCAFRERTETYLDHTFSCQVETVEQNIAKFCGLGSSTAFFGSLGNLMLRKPPPTTRFPPGSAGGLANAGVTRSSTSFGALKVVPSVYLELDLLLQTDYCFMISPELPLESLAMLRLEGSRVPLVTGRDRSSLVSKRYQADERIDLRSRPCSGANPCQLER